MADYAVSTAFLPIDKISGAFKKMGRSAGMFENKATKSFRNVGRAGSRVGSIIKGIIGAQIITRGIAALTQGLRTVTTEFIGFDQAVTSASSKFKGLNLVTQEGQKTLEALKRTARDVGAVTQFTAGQAAKGLDFLAMAGFNAEQAMASLAPTVDLATVGQLDLGRATDIATDSLGAFDLMTEDTNQLQKNFIRLNDVMALTMSRTNTNMEDMFESIKKGAPAFTAAGQSMESFNTLLGVMANSGVKGSESGTVLRNVMLRLANPTGAAKTALDKLGVITQDSAGNFRDIIDILGDFEVGLKGMGTAQKTAALSTIFGTRAVTGVNILLAEGTDQLSAFRNELLKAGGASKNMANIIRQSLQNRLAALRSAAIEVGFKFVQAFEKRGGKAIDAITQAIRNFNIQPIIDGVEFVIKIFQKLIIFVRPLIETIIKIGIEIFQMFKETGIGALLIDNVGFAFRNLTSAIKIMWQIAKPILQLLFILLEPILIILNAITTGIVKVAEFLGQGGGAGPSMAEFEAAGRARAAPNAAATKTEEGRFKGTIDVRGLPGLSTATSSGSGSARDIDLRLLGNN